MARITETQNTKQKSGEAILGFEVTDSLKIRFFRTVYNNGTWEKKDELASQETIQNDNIIAEYKGPFYDEFIWYINRKKMEGNGPRLSMKVTELPNSAIDFKLTATSKNRTNIAESEATLKVIYPAIVLQPREEIIKEKEEEGSNQNRNSNNKPAAYEVPLDAEVDIITQRKPEGSSFAARGDLKYFWSLNGEEMKEGKDNYKLLLTSEKYFPQTPHTLDVKIYSPDRILFASGGISLMAVKNKNTNAVGESKSTIGRFAFVYLNLPGNLRFLLENIIWAAIIYFLLNGVAWLAVIGDKKRI